MSLVQERMKIYDASLLDQGRHEGRQQGRQETLGLLSTAVELHKRGVSLDEIHAKTLLPQELLIRLFGSQVH